MSDQDSFEEEVNRALLPGSQLQEARESKGMSVADAALVLKITESYVRALESDDYSHLPQAAFVRGYLRNYAKILGLNGSELVAGYDQYLSERGEVVLKLDVENTMKQLRAHSSPSSVNALILILVVSFGGLSYYLWNNWLKPAPSSAVAVDESSAPVSQSVLTPETEDAVIVVDDSAAVGVVADDQLKDESAQILSDEPVIPEVIETSSSDDVDALLKNLMISFKDECWVEVTDATGEILISSVQQSGSSIDLEVVPPVSVRFGNSPAVDQIVFDGELVPNPKSRSRVASLEISANEQG